MLLFLLNFKLYLPFQCNKPVIAAVHSGCLGGGVDLITACDIRLQTNDAWYSVKVCHSCITYSLFIYLQIAVFECFYSLIFHLYVNKEVDVGIAADLGTLQRLPKIIGNDSLARELCFTARPLKAQEAKECGLVRY